MREPDDRDSVLSAAASEACAQCGMALSSHDRVAAGDRTFCRSCYASLRAELAQAVEAMSADVNYVNATIGAVLGAAAGALLWWGFTVATKLSFGLVAIAIGYLTGLGAVKFAGGKRSAGLQAISVAAALAGYAAGTFLVNMTFVNRAFAERGESFRVAFPPQSPELLWRVLAAGFGMMDAVFLAIVVYEAWKIPRPVALPPDAA